MTEQDILIALVQAVFTGDTRAEMLEALAPKKAEKEEKEDKNTSISTQSVRKQ